jgi:hypothetical protein
MMNNIRLPLHLLTIVSLLFLLSGCGKMGALLNSNSPSAPETEKTPAATTASSSALAINPISSVIGETLNYFNQISQLSDEQLKKEQQKAKQQFTKNPTVENRLRMALVTGLSPRHADPEQALKWLSGFSKKELETDASLRAYVSLLHNQLQQQAQQSQLQMQLQESKMQQVKLQSELQQTHAQKAQLESKLEALKTIEAQFSSRPAITPTVTP